ncbi:DUF4012 domain-containing protein [Candidatus Woesebacteria bacterium]|nr:DUF4012 domain-containing protein [Candidatus Woesebacteria bacterium]
MKLTIEYVEEQSVIAIIAKQYSSFAQRIKEQLKDYNVELFQDETPESIDEFDVLFLINRDDIDIAELISQKNKKTTIVLFRQGDYAQYLCNEIYKKKAKHIKVINLQTQKQYYKKDVDTILWFSFSQTPDAFLYIYNPPIAPKKKIRRKLPLGTRLKKTLLKPRTLILTGLWLFIMSQVLFLFPLGVATYHNYQLARTLVAGDIQTAKKHVSQARANLTTSRKFYTASQPLFRFINIGLAIDNMFQLNESAIVLGDAAIQVKHNTTDILEHIQQSNKSTEELATLNKEYDETFSLLETIKAQADIVTTKIPEIHPSLVAAKERIAHLSETLAAVDTVEPIMSSFIKSDGEKTYLVLFANNMELRPGGGFIGSFAIVHTKPFTLDDIHVYDVYDADGQLTERIEPPKPISEYLHQPFWFLRDSAFSPDFPTNAQQAHIFTSLELPKEQFDGTILITTSAVQNLLASMGDVYIPDYKENINKDNFYIKTQLYAEDDFFPGSQSKKRFLTSVMNQILLAIPQASGPELVQAIQTSLDEKQMVIAVDDKDIQARIDKKYWAGRMLTPQCSLPDAVNCVLDYVFLVDANLGVNKANYFIQRPTKMNITISEEGNITNTVSFTYANTSYDDVFPGGTYKNYLQMFLPPNAQIDNVLMDGKPVQNTEETNIDYRTIGFFLTVNPQSVKTIEITYTLPTTIVKGKGVYQLIFQKQIGYPNEELHMRVSLPSNVTVERNNFTPLANSRNIDYNTTISSDKIFVLEFNKQ